MIGVNIYDPSHDRGGVQRRRKQRKGKDSEKASSEEVSSKTDEKNLKETSEAENTAESEE